MNDSSLPSSPTADDAHHAEDALPADVHRVQLGEKEVLLIGTAHISRESVDLVEHVIASERPDVVCVELDDERFAAIRDRNRWQELDLKEVIKKGQLMFLMARLALTAFQKRMGSYTGVKPGAEMVAAIERAEAMGAEVVLCDRNVRTTLLRAWRMTPFWRRSALAASLVAGVFERNEISEADLAQLRQSHNINTILDEMGDVLPSVKTVLVDERDEFMAHQIQKCPGKKVVAVVGAAHTPGILRHLGLPVSDARIEAISAVPERSAFARLLPWLIPTAILVMFALGFYYGKTDELRDAAVAWIVVNGGLSALGTLLALGHPLTIVTAFIAAPITSLNPTIGAGMVTAFVQTLLVSPKVRDMEQVGDDIARWQGWWTNRLARIFLVFFLSSLGSAIGTFASLHWLKDLV